MRILQLITGLGRGGAEQVVFHLATRLDRARFDVSVCSLLDLSGAPGFYAASLREAGIEVRSLGLTGRWQFRRALALRKVLEELKPDVLHCHLFHANVLGRWVGGRAGVRRIVSTVHTGQQRRRPWRYWLERWTDSLGTRTVCVSNTMLRQYARRTGLPADRFLVIRNGIDTARFARPERRREEVRAELGIPADALLIGAVGRLERVKGPDVLLRSFCGFLARERPALRLAFAGDGPMRGVLDATALDAGCGGRVHFLGPRADVSELLHAFDVFVLPSRSEGLPLALVEAMAAGVPIVATSVGSVGEVLGSEEPEGPAGRLVPPEDAKRLAAAVGDALENPRPDQVQRAQARARTLFDAATMVESYTRLYDSLGGQSAESQPPSA